MKIAVLALTRRGAILAGRVAEMLALEPGRKISLFIKEEHVGDRDRLKFQSTYFIEGNLTDLVGELFQTQQALVMVMALGIVVRVISPHLRDKRTDPAVITMDEGGHYAISTLSGHLGGANELCRLIAQATGSSPVITTATDVNGLTAVDVLARKYNLTIEPFDKLKKVNSALVNGDEVLYFTEHNFPENNFKSIKRFQLGENLPGNPWVVLLTCRELGSGDKLLTLRPRNLVAGVGCKKGAAAREILSSITVLLEKAGLSPSSLGRLATVDLKSSEPGLLQAAETLNIPLLSYSRGEINDLFAQRDDLERSKFVQQRIGVGGVCEPAALLASRQGRLVVTKTKFPGITLALAEDSAWWDLGQAPMTI